MKQKKPNPQGKGLSTVLDALVDSQVKTSLPPKNIDQVSSELFTSLFVLNTNFEFRPVAGNSYWLYHTNDKFKLFSTAPNAWACGQPGIFIGECVLQNDVTWTIQLRPRCLATRMVHTPSASTNISSSRSRWKTRSR